MLSPLAFLFEKITSGRRRCYQKRAYKSRLPVIIVGNITVGGTGKTPLVEALYRDLKAKGDCPAIISRGFGGKSSHYPLIVDEKTPPEICGDEPFMLKERLENAVIVIDPDRTAAVKYIETHFPEVGLIISDDGLQHYRLHRDVEIAVVDGARLFGNGLCLPAGPLREPVSRLNEVDAVLVNGMQRFAACKNPHRMMLKPVSFVNIKTGKSQTLADFISASTGEIHAVAGIGNPQRFFDLLCDVAQKPVVPHAFADHHRYQRADFAFADVHTSVVMTHKDAVKCRKFAEKNWWYLQVSPDIDATFFDAINKKLKHLGNTR